MVDPDEELEMLVILRMNRKFMLVMREHYNQLTKRITSDGRTIVDADAGVKSFMRIMRSVHKFIHVHSRETSVCASRFVVHEQSSS